VWVGWAGCGSAWVRHREGRGAGALCDRRCRSSRGGGVLPHRRVLAVRIAPHPECSAGDGGAPCEVAEASWPPAASIDLASGRVRIVSSCAFVPGFLYPTEVGERFLVCRAGLVIVPPCPAAIVCRVRGRARCERPLQEVRLAAMVSGTKGSRRCNAR